MSWPTPQEYNEAIQHPERCFEDPALQSGRVAQDAFGLPRPITGNFASVYRLRCDGRDWAVKCFWRSFADLPDRYAAISAALRASGLASAIGFEYLPRGIRVGGVWYPILKMEWARGVPLDEAIRACLRDPAALVGLANRWAALVAAWARAGLAHGDLQHGNVLAVGERLRLVDYDGMFVPALAGAIGHELGHPNYQHPRRATTDFGPHLDHFSAWSIYVSLVALSIDPSLWRRCQAGDDCLLFRRRDYEAPASSPAFTVLIGHTDARIRALGDRIREMLDLEPAGVPPLDGVPVLAAPRGMHIWVERQLARSRERAAVLAAGGRRRVAALRRSAARVARVRARPTPVARSGLRAHRRAIAPVVALALAVWFAVGVAERNVGGIVVHPASTVIEVILALGIGLGCVAVVCFVAALVSGGLTMMLTAARRAVSAALGRTLGPLVDGAVRRRRSLAYPPLSRRRLRVLGTAAVLVPPAWLAVGISAGDLVAAVLRPAGCFAAIAAAVPVLARRSRIAAILCFTVADLYRYSRTIARSLVVLCAHLLGLTVGIFFYGYFAFIFLLLQFGIPAAIIGALFGASRPAGLVVIGVIFCFRRSRIAVARFAVAVGRSNWDEARKALGLLAQTVRSLLRDWRQILDSL